MTEKMMMAMVGSSTADGKSSGFMSQGLCIPLAASPILLEVVESLGEDAVAEWLSEDNEIPAPDAGGLWVIECVVEDSEDSEVGCEITSWKWREPRADEITALHMRTYYRARGIKHDTEDTRDLVTDLNRWVFVGALV